MDDTNTMTREQELLEEFKAGLEKDGPMVLAERIAALEEENGRLIKELDQSEKDGAGTDDQIRALTEERDAAIKRADAAEAVGKKATAEVKKLTTPAKPRRIGEMGDGKSLGGDALRAAIADAETIEIVFSDGAREVAGLAPIGVSGEAWTRHAFGLMLNQPIEIEGPDGAASVSIAGYALLIDGKQVAWRARDVRLQVAPRQRVTISDDIIFM